LLLQLTRPDAGSHEAKARYPSVRHMREEGSVMTPFEMADLLESFEVIRPLSGGIKFTYQDALKYEIIKYLRAARQEPTEAMVEAGADAFLQAKDDWKAKHPKGYGSICPLMVTLPAAYKAMVSASPNAAGHSEGESK
jgi:hypothetical protein